MSKCQRCQSARIASVSAKCSDLCFMKMESGREHDGYVPKDMGIGGGDYVEFSYCLSCGQIQGVFPMPSTLLETDPIVRRPHD